MCRCQKVQQKPLYHNKTLIPHFVTKDFYHKLQLFGHDGEHKSSKVCIEIMWNFRMMSQTLSLREVSKYATVN